MDNVMMVNCQSNDTWARDHGAITLVGQKGIRLMDFGFNGWGLKFASNYDNLITEQLVKLGVLEGEYCNCRNFIFEGGSIESDGQGSLLTTTECLISGHRNATYTPEVVEPHLLS